MTNGRQKLVPELLVRDLDASLEFWRDLLGFEIMHERPEEGFAYLDLHGAQLMLERRDDAFRQWLTGQLQFPFGRGINFQIAVPSVDAILARLEAATWPLFMPLEKKWYATGEIEKGQRQFLVQDPDGYLVRLAEDIGQRPIMAR